MKKSESYTEKINIKELLLSKENDNFLESDELYNLIKEDYHAKIKSKALKLLPSNSFNSKHSKRNSESSTNQNTSSITKNLLPKIPHHRRETSDTNNKLKSKKSVFLTHLLTESKKTLVNSKSMNHINSVYSLLDKKISYDKLLNLRAKFFSGQKLTRGELTEMMFGKTIPFIKTKTFSEDYQKKIMEVLSNDPQLIINLIKFGKVTKQEVIDYFNLDALNLDWNEELEKKYREIVYNKNKTNSNMLKTTFFLVNIGFHKILRQKFEERHLITTKTYNQKEINEFAIIYEKLKKYDLETLIDGYAKVEYIYHIRDLVVHNKITYIRNVFFERKVKKFRKIRNKNEKWLTEANEVTKEDICDMKKCIYNIRTNIFKKFPNKIINRYDYTKTITKLNEKVHNKSDIKNIITINKIKRSKNYVKTLIAELRKEGSLPYNNNIKQFEWQTFYKHDSSHKQVINYFSGIIQATFRGYMIRKWIEKMKIASEMIQFNVIKYLSFKKMVMSLFTETVEDIKEFDKLNPEIYRAPARRIRQIVHALLRNYPSCSFYMFDRDVDQINMLYVRNLVPKQIMVGKIVKSHKLLIFLDNCLFKLYHKE